MRLRREFGGNLIEPRSVPGHEDEIVTRGQEAGEAQTDPRGGTGDDRR